MDNFADQAFDTMVKKYRALEIMILARCERSEKPSRKLQTMINYDYNHSMLEVPEERPFVSHFFGHAEQLLGFSIPWFEVSLLFLLICWLR
jgi:hypothetical protein